MRTDNTYSTLTSIVHLTGYQPGVNSCAIDGDQYNVGCIVQTPNLLIGEHSPTQISIWRPTPTKPSQSISMHRTLVPTGPPW